MYPKQILIINSFINWFHFRDIYCKSVQNVYHTQLKEQPPMQNPESETHMNFTKIIDIGVKIDKWPLTLLITLFG